METLEQYIIDRLPGKRVYSPSEILKFEKICGNAEVARCFVRKDYDYCSGCRLSAEFCLCDSGTPTPTKDTRYEVVDEILAKKIIYRNQLSWLFSVERVECNIPFENVKQVFYWVMCEEPGKKYLVINSDLSPAHEFSQAQYALDYFAENHQLIIHDWR